MPKPSIYIFYITEFSGHFQAARNIKDSLENFLCGENIRFINIFSSIFPTSEKVVNFFYNLTIRKFPLIWDKVYDRKFIIDSLRGPHYLIKILAVRKLKELFQSSRPICVVTTQAFPCGLVSFYKKNFGDNFLLLACITDYFPHRFWIEEGVDYYIVPSIEAKNYLLREGVRGGKILEFGIPLAPKFFKEISEDEVREEFSIPCGRNILVMGGGQGIGPIEKVVNFLDGYPQDFNILVVCGRNKRLYKRLNDSHFRKSVHVFGYINFVHKLMAISSIIITKPGGITITEALSKGLYIIAFRPLPGQEMNNVRFLRKYGLGKMAKSVREIADSLTQILNNKEMLEKHKKRVKELFNFDSPSRIREFIKDKCISSTE